MSHSNVRDSGNEELPDKLELPKYMAMVPKEQHEDEDEAARRKLEAASAPPKHSPDSEDDDSDYGAGGGFFNSDHQKTIPLKSMLGSKKKEKK